MIPTLRRNVPSLDVAFVAGRHDFFSIVKFSI